MAETADILVIDFETNDLSGFDGETSESGGITWPTIL